MHGMIIDAHAHLHVAEFDVDRDVVVRRAREAGVDFIAVGFEPEGNEKAAQLAETYDTFWTAGIHPHNADLATEKNLNRIRELARGPQGKKLVALGEMGLDYFKNRQTREAQHEALRAQLRLARELDLPIIIHCRDAFADALKILKDEGIIRALFHCFTGTIQEAQECWSRGYHASFTGICTYPGAQAVREAIKQAPEDRILIESDCPFLAPQKHRGKRNEPAFLRETLAKVAEVRGVPGNHLEEDILKNTRSFFQLL